MKVVVIMQSLISNLLKAFKNQNGCLILLFAFLESLEMNIFFPYLNYLMSKKVLMDFLMLNCLCVPGKITHHAVLL